MLSKAGAKKSPWRWNERTGRYHDTATNRFIGHAAMLKLRDRFVEAQRSQASHLAQRLATGRDAGAGAVYSAYSTQWREAMRTAIKTTFTDQYLLGHGGRKTMTPQDWGRLGAMIRKQNAYLERFVADVRGGKYTLEDGKVDASAIGARAELYMKASVLAFERGRALGMGVPELPAYPADGTDCLVNCRCAWQIARVEAEGAAYSDAVYSGELLGWNCTWVVRGDAHTCETCDERGRRWSPLFVPNPFARTAV
jgi:hypothetical protein